MSQAAMKIITMPIDAKAPNSAGMLATKMVV